MIFFWPTGVGRFFGCNKLKILYSSGRVWWLGVYRWFVILVCLRFLSKYLLDI